MYYSDELTDLHQLKNDVEAIFPDGGGDCRELGMKGILRALNISHEDSNIIVLTDASCKDCEERHEVVRIARLLNVKIHFFLSGYGCGFDNFPYYTYVQQATEGISVNSIESLEAFLYLFLD